MKKFPTVDRSTVKSFLKELNARELSMLEHEIYKEQDWRFKYSDRSGKIWEPGMTRRLPRGTDVYDDDAWDYL